MFRAESSSTNKYSSYWHSHDSECVRRLRHDFLAGGLCNYQGLLHGDLILQLVFNLFDVVNVVFVDVQVA